MKNLFSATAIGLGLLASIGGVQQATAVTITNTTPVWSNISGGSNTQLNFTEGTLNNTITEARWGVPASGNPNNTTAKSGLGFNPANPPASTPAINIAFLLGTLTHFNNPINSGTAATSVDLDLTTTITSANPAVQTFEYRFLIDETPNAPPCAYTTSPAGPACADRISFVNLDTTSSFNIGGVDYTIVLQGFSSNNGTTITTDFISNEGGSNNIGLYGIITQATHVPEPATLALLGAATVGLGLVRRRKTA